MVHDCCIYVSPIFDVEMSLILHVYTLWFEIYRSVCWISLQKLKVEQNLRDCRGVRRHRKGEIPKFKVTVQS
jgi:hypothetical protein